MVKRVEIEGQLLGYPRSIGTRRGGRMGLFVLGQGAEPLNKKTVYVRVLVFGGLVSVCDKHLSPGRKVLVTGRMRAERRYERFKDGVAVSAELEADSVIFLDDIRRSRQRSFPPPGPLIEPDGSYPILEDWEDEIPF